MTEYRRKDNKKMHLKAILLLLLDLLEHSETERAIKCIKEILKGY